MKKKLTVLKKALLDERSAREDLQGENQFLKKKQAEIEEENNATNDKYLKLYDENDRLSEQLQELQAKITQGSTGAMKDNFSSDLKDFGSSITEDLKKLNPANLFKSDTEEKKEKDDIAAKQRELVQ